MPRCTLGTARGSAPPRPTQSSTRGWIRRGFDVQANSAVNPSASLNAMTATADYSRYVQRARRRFDADIAALASGVPDMAAIEQLIDRLLQQGRSLAAAL